VPGWSHPTVSRRDLVDDLIDGSLVEGIDCAYDAA
jgi:hypothetical protein